MDVDQATTNRKGTRDLVVVTSCREPSRTDMYRIDVNMVKKWMGPAQCS